ncbi:hypothetical protein D3261_00760 [Halococcus sp. IIIV-5B]|nr:hypothetical protein D3261_00760 [Halococcus sp. IIIV-5B]
MDNSFTCLCDGIMMWSSAISAAASALKFDLDSIFEITLRSPVLVIREQYLIHAIQVDRFHKK